MIKRNSRLFACLLSGPLDRCLLLGFHYFDNYFLFLDEEGTDYPLLHTFVAENTSVGALNHLLPPAHARPLHGPSGHDTPKLFLALSTSRDLLGFLQVLIHQSATWGSDTEI